MIGVKPNVHASPNLNITCPISGDIPAFINTGTAVDAIMVYFVAVFGRTNVDIAVTKNNNNINGIPLKELTDIKLVNKAVITVPIFVFLNTLINTDAININTIVLPIPSNECPR